MSIIMQVGIQITCLLFLQTIDECKVHRTTKSLLECVEEEYVKYNVTRDSQFWSLASKAGTVRQEVTYTCNNANPPISFIGWDETEFYSEDDALKCNVQYALSLAMNNHIYISG